MAGESCAGRWLSSRPSGMLPMQGSVGWGLVRGLRGSNSLFAALTASARGFEAAAPVTHSSWLSARLFLSSSSFVQGDLTT